MPPCQPPAMPNPIPIPERRRLPRVFHGVEVPDPVPHGVASRPVPAPACPRPARVSTDATRRCLGIIGWLFLIWCRVAAVDPQPVGSELVEFAGTVEIARPGVGWVPAQVHQGLQSGDQLRTAHASRATLRLSDRSVVRVDQDTLIELRSPEQPGATRRFLLRLGGIFLLNRERPTAVEFETPVASGAIRGTEFVLRSDPVSGATRLALLEGAVDLTGGGQTVVLSPGQQAEVLPGGRPQVSAMVSARNVIQWVLYYPAVFDPAEVGWPGSAPAVWGPSLSAYAAGDLPGAVRAAPPEVPGEGEEAKCYRAALDLAVGQVTSAEGRLDGTVSARFPGVADALRVLIATVRFEAIDETRAPAGSAGWLARSYWLQSRTRLGEALAAARRAVELAPQSGFAWTRVAELEMSFGRRKAAREALREARARSPRHAPALALEGFLALAENDPVRAAKWFDQAVELDGAFGLGWLGRGLALGRAGDSAEARRSLEIAAALEPNRSEFRSYLGRAFSEEGEPVPAAKDFRLAKELDPADPTAWYYSGLEAAQDNRPIPAVRDLARAIELNDNRAVFRSRLLLDQDRAARSADLAAILSEAGLDEVARRSASRAVSDDYADFSGHLLVARSLQLREDPNRFNLRYETPRQAELLVANLLAPAGAGNLSQVLSQQDHLRNYGLRPIGVSSFTEYRSRGDWEQSGSVFGDLRGFGYALDTQYISRAGQRPGADSEQLRIAAQTRWQVTPEDGLYLQLAWADTDAGDVAQHFDLSEVRPGFRAHERQEPQLLAGYHHEWSPGSHTLVLAGWAQDRLSVTNPGAAVLFLHQRGGKTVGVEDYGGQLGLDYRSDFQVGTVEAQQIWEGEHHGLVAGVRYQLGEIDAQARLTPALPSFVVDDSVRPGLERISGYTYYSWRPVPGLRLTAGLAYDEVRHPVNADLAPLVSGEVSRSAVEPKVSVDYVPWRGGRWRAAYARSLGGLYFDDSLRLEPTQLAGFTTAYRSLVPESAAGLVPGTLFDTAGFGFDQSFTNGLYLGVEVEWLRSDGERQVGALTNSLPVPVADSPAQVRQGLDYRERNIAVYATQLLGDHWAAGMRYRLSEAELRTQFPDLTAEAFTEASSRRRERAVLGQWGAYLIFNHESGWFARWQSDWVRQANHWDDAEMGTGDFWQHSVYAGYRWSRHRAEVRLGVLNLTDQDYRLNPVNLTAEFPRARTFYASLRLNF